MTQHVTETVEQAVTPVQPRVDPVVAGEPTGDADVDAVVASLSGLDDRPVAEHVTVFEQAHESLRRALADAGESTTPRS